MESRPESFLVLSTSVETADTDSADSKPAIKGGVIADIILPFQKTAPRAISAQLFRQRL